MNFPKELRYAKSHEWVRLEADGTATVGITEHAQELLGDMVFVENPQAGRKLKQDEECAVVESVKAASDVYAPISGEVIAVNADVESAPVAQSHHGLFRNFVGNADARRKQVIGCFLIQVKPDALRTGD